MTFEINQRQTRKREQLVLQIIENLHWNGLSVLEEAKTYKRLLTDFGLNQTEIGKRVGKSKQSINEILRVLDLPEEIIGDVRTSGHLSKSVLVEIAKYPSEKKRLALLKQAKTGRLTVKRLRDMRKQQTHEPSSLRNLPPLKVPQGEIILRMAPGYHSEKVMKQMLREGLILLGEKEQSQDILDVMMGRDTIQKAG